MRPSAFYDLGPHLLEVRASTDALGERFDRSFGELRSARAGTAAFHLDLVEAALPDPPRSFQLIYEGPFPGDRDGRFFAADSGSFLIFPGETALSVQDAERRATITVAKGNDGRAGSTVSVAAIEAAADSVGQVMLHAAALTLPGEGRIILIYAPSGTGKTTTTLALLSAGFGLCSDDAAFIGRVQTGFLGWGFPCGLKVHRKTALLLPWLAPNLEEDWDGNDEQTLSRRKVAGIVRVEDYAPRTVAALFRLVRGIARETAIVPIARTDVLASIAADNVRIGPTGLLPLQQRRFAMLSQISASLPVYEIRAGNDLSGLAPAIKASLSQATAVVDN